MVRTYNYIIKYLVYQRLNIDFQQKWLVKLMKFDFSIEYHMSQENMVVVLQ